jgi:hypothetical protein
MVTFPSATLSACDNGDGALPEQSSGKQDHTHSPMRHASGSVVEILGTALILVEDHIVLQDHLSLTPANQQEIVHRLSANRRNRTAADLEIRTDK